MTTGLTQQLQLCPAKISLLCSVHTSCVDELFHHLAYEFRLLWWIGPGCMPDAHQSHSISRTGDRKYDKKLVHGDEDRERSLTHYCHRQNRRGLG